jgi:hypothetical protein
MKIDDTLEIAVRNTFAASVDEDPEQFDAAVGAILDRGDDFTVDAFQLTISVASVILQDIHDGEIPKPDQIADLAADFAETQEDWSTISAEVAAAYMAAAVGDEPVLDVMSPGDIANAGPAVGGWLLSAFLPEPPAEEKEWTDYLDEVLAVLESPSDEDEDDEDLEDNDEDDEDDDR